MSTLQTIIAQNLEILEWCNFLQLVKQRWNFCLILNLFKCDNSSWNYQENDESRHNEDSAKLNELLYFIFYGTCFNHSGISRFCVINVCNVDILKLHPVCLKRYIFYRTRNVSKHKKKYLFNIVDFCFSPQEKIQT